MLQDGSQNKKSSNIRSKNNQRIFGVSMIALQILVSLIYSFYGIVGIQAININSVLTTIFFMMLAIIGFGLFFGYFKNLIWNGLGFSLLITALSIQIYPLVNALWAKAAIHQSGIYSDSFNNQRFYVYMASIDSVKYQNNTISAAVKCALSIIVAFGSVIGRIGPLECFIMTMIGNLGYELNRSFNINYGQDSFGTFSIFTYGGFYGLTIGIIMAIREKRKNIGTYRNPQLEASGLTAISSLIGGIFIFLLFPFLAYQGDQSLQTVPIHRALTPVSVFLSMGSSMIASICASLLHHGQKKSCIRSKDLLNAIVAGGVVVGAASFYIDNPFLPVLSGTIAGFLQYVFDNWFEKFIYNKFGLVSTYSFSLFCIQSFLGAIFAAGFNGRIETRYFYTANLKDYGQQFVIFFISGGFGIASGILAGLPCFFLNRYKTSDLFHDKSEFRPNDGISFRLEKSVAPPDKSLIKKPESVIHIQPNLPEDTKQPINPSQPENEPAEPPQEPDQPSEYSDDEFSFDFADMLQVAIQ